MEAAKLKTEQRRKSSPNYGITFQPIPNSPQERAYYCTADVIGYGGAAGGGKSYLMLGKALTQHKRSRILRARYTDLQRLIDDGDTILQGIASYVSGTKRRWDLPDGRMVMLRAADKMKDVKKHKGDRVDFLAFDEADEFPEDMIRFMMGWAGTTELNQRVQVMLAFNPPDATGEWLIDYFAAWIDENHENPAQDGEIRYYIRHNDEDIEVDSADVVTIDGEDYTPQSRTFFKALVDDNPYAIATGYDKQLDNMPEPYRSMYRKGLFNVGKADERYQVIPTHWIIEAEKRWIESDKPLVAMRALGVDVARGGKDDNVLAPLYGTYFDDLLIRPGKETHDGYDVHDFVLEAIGNDSPIIGIDVVGVGSSPYDLLKIHSHLSVFAVNSGQGVQELDETGKYGFANVRAYAWWKFREALNPNSGENIALPPIRSLRNELRAPTYKIRSGRYVIESKDEIRKRIGRSTDHADAVIYAWLAALVGNQERASVAEVIF